jgi:hypothetical protein
MELKLGSLGESNYSHPDVLTRRIAKMAKDREEKIRMSRIVNGRIGKIGKPMISNSILSYPAYRAVYDLAYPVFTNIALGIDSIRFFFICYLPVGGTKRLDRFALR